MPRFSVSLDVGAGADEVREAFSDYESYPAAIPEYCGHVRTRSSRGAVSVAEERLRLGGRDLLVTARHDTGGGRHSIRFIGGDARGSSMVMSFAGAAGGTRVTMDVDLRISTLRPGRAREDCLGMLRGLSRPFP